MCDASCGSPLWARIGRVGTDARAFATDKRRLRPLDAKTAGAPWIHFAANASAGYRIFTHWYTFFLFDDGPTDAFYKRFGRDRLRYQDDIFCAAGRVSRALALEAARHSKKSGGDRAYSAAHVRRGELQYVSVRISADEWNATLADWVRPKEVLFVLSDETDATWFAPLAAQFRLFFLRDFEDLLADLDDPNARGMVEQLVAAAPNCRTFTGTFFSTFSSYVARLRAYYDHAPDTFFYAAPPAKKRVLHDTVAPHYPFFNREWPLAWTGIDRPAPVARAPRPRLTDDLRISDVPLEKSSYPKARVDAALRKEKKGAS